MSERGAGGRRCQGLVVCWGVSAAGRSQEECRRGAGARRGVMNWNDSGGGGTFSRDRRGLLSPAAGGVCWVVRSLGLVYPGVSEEGRGERGGGRALIYPGVRR